jgi:peptidoglycan hydrolase-like amidase
MTLRSRTAFALLALMLASSLGFAQDVRIGVLGLFHPRQLTLTALPGSALIIRAAKESLVLERSSGFNSADIRLSGGSIVVAQGTHVLRTSEVTVTGRDSQPVDFQLAVPGKLSRQYRGILEVSVSAQSLSAVVQMDLETAVASVVAAENLTGTPVEALKAQAVATRSFFVAGKGRHHSFDFCDTTHCQFLREPPAPDSAAAKATSATRGLVMAYESEPFAAMYTRSCSGRTRTPAELGLQSGRYPYYAVDCKYCREHPSRWQSQLSIDDAALLRTSNEGARLRIDRQIGWSAVPSNTFVGHKEGSHMVLQGVGEGHGMGLCQAGAKAMAEEGANFRQILSHYYPNTSIVSLERSSPGGQ